MPLIEKKSSLTQAVLAGTALTLLLAGCSNRELGSVLDNPTFGVSATQNRINQLSILSEADTSVSLGAQFQEAVEDVIYFDFNSVELTLAARLILNQQAAWLQETPGARFELAGHADRVGSTEYNAELGLQRATAALNYLVSAGVDRSRLNAVATFGEDDPAVETEEQEPLNRRVVTRVLGTASFGTGDTFDGRVADQLYDRYQTGQPVTLQNGGQIGQD